MWWKPEITPDLSMMLVTSHLRAKGNVLYERLLKMLDDSECKGGGVG